MTDAQSFALVLILVHLFECVAWARPGAVVFRCLRVGSWSVTRPVEWAGAVRGGPVLGWPVPPFGGLLVCADWPVIPTPEALFVRGAPSRPGAAAVPARGIAWTALEAPLCSGPRVDLGAGEVVECASGAEAQAVAELVSAIAARSRIDRASAIDVALRAHLDAAAVTARVADWVKATRVLSVTTSLAFAAYAVALAGLLGLPQLSGVWVWAGLAYLPLAVLTIVDARRAHAVLAPGDSAGRRRMTLLLALSPLSAMSARTLLSRDRLPLGHPLAVARALLPPSAFEELARSGLARLRHPPGGDGDGVERDARATELRLVEERLVEWGLDVDALLAPPERSPGARGWCPRCRARYDRASGECTDCAVALRSFEESHAARGPSDRGRSEA